MEDFKKIIHVGTCEFGRIFCKIVFNNGHLSITGVIGPRSNGDANACGQLNEMLKGVEIKKWAPGWDEFLFHNFLYVWDNWHLNDMRAYCSHMKILGWHKEAERPVNLYTWNLTPEAKACRKRASEGEKGLKFYVDLPEQIQTIEDKDFSDYKGRHNVYRLDKTESNRLGWIRYNNGGLLGRPCPVCGYKYGHAWLAEEVPETALEFLKSLPDTNITPAWV